tara:strand:+ start:4580 stop:5347 length:768 start_codon:yes stop_codon:yes gene_type:complete
MKHKTPFITLLMLFLNSSAVLSQEYNAAVFNQNEKTLPYRILLPESYESNKNYPLVLFLHGSGERGNDNELQLFHGSKMFLDAEFREKNPAIVVFPQCPADSYWATVEKNSSTKFSYFEKPKYNPTLSLVEGMLEQIILKYGVDQDRIYVGGLSMGGMGTFELVYRNPNKFAAAFAICGGAHPKIARKIKKPVWRIDHGDADAVVPIEFSKAMVDALIKNKADVTYNWYTGVGHNSWENVFADPGFIPWLFSQKK